MANLPEQFNSLEPFLDDWAHGTELARSQRRWNASREEYEALYAAMFPLLDEVLAYLDQYKLGEIPAHALALYHLSLAFAEAAPHNELYDCQSQVPNSFDASRFIAAHGNDVDR